MTNELRRRRTPPAEATRSLATPTTTIRQLRLTWIVYVLVVVSCLCQTSVVAAQVQVKSTRNTQFVPELLPQRQLQNSERTWNDQDPSLPEPQRVTMGPFSVRLAPTPLPFEAKSLDALYVYIQETLVSYMKQRTGAGLSIRYFVMTDIGVQETEGNVSTLRIGEGAAMFDVATATTSRAQPPPPQQIEVWMRTAIDTQLVSRLADTEFYYVQEARFVSLSESAVVVHGDSVRGDVVSASSSGNSRADAALRASVVLAGVAVVLLGALLIRSHRQRSRDSPPTATITLDNHTTATYSNANPPPADMDEVKPPMTSSTPRSLAYANPEEEASTPRRTTSRMDVDARSLAESESSWTVATEMGDSAAVHSVATNPSQALVSTESFEHDRQIYLQKDMLTTTWSGNNAIAGPVISESVLQPSHFTAAQGRRGSRSWVDTDDSPAPFIFASHDDADVGEEVFLMPEDRGQSEELV